MYKNYYSYNDMPIVGQAYEKPLKTQEVSKPKPPENTKKSMGILDNLSTDDTLLIMVILLLLADGCQDTLLLLAIGFIFISVFF